jgi:hypothetical protein
MNDGKKGTWREGTKETRRMSRMFKAKWHNQNK